MFIVYAFKRSMHLFAGMYAVLWPNICCVFATKLCAPTTYQRLDANILPTFTSMLRPFVGLVRISSREWFLTYYTKTTNKEFTILSPFVGLVRTCSREWFSAHTKTTNKEFNKMTDEAMRQSS